MANLVRFIAQYTPFYNCPSYYPLPKKDDDQAIRNAEVWVNATPVNSETLRTLDIYQSQDYIKQVIEKLKKCYVNSSNEEIVKTHLVRICKTNSLFQQFVFNQLAEISADSNIIRSLRNTICATYPSSS